jgi:hypothetical protein
VLFVSANLAARFLVRALGAFLLFALSLLGCVHAQALLTAATSAGMSLPAVVTIRAS